MKIGNRQNWVALPGAQMSHARAKVSTAQLRPLQLQLPPQYRRTFEEYSERISAFSHSREANARASELSFSEHNPSAFESPEHIGSAPHPQFFPILDVDTFIENLKDSLNANADVNKGFYAIRIGRFNQPDKTILKGVQNMTTKLPLFATSALALASVSKMMTGAAVVRALEDFNISENQPIYKFFPKAWGAPHTMFSAITIRDCLQYRAGLPQSGGGLSSSVDGIFNFYKYANWGGTLLNPSLIGPNKPQSYHNMCYSYFRIALPYMTMNADEKYVAELIYNQNPSYWEEYISKMYVKYVRTLFFDPLQAFANVAPPATSTVRYYKSYPPSTSNSFSGPDNLLTTASEAGWYLSVATLQDFMRLIRWGGGLGSSTGKIFNFADSLQAYVFADFRNQHDSHGTTLIKAGTQTGIKSLVCSFPNYVQLSAISNCDVPINTLQTRVLEAYDASWI